MFVGKCKEQVLNYYWKFGYLVLVKYCYEICDLHLTFKTATSNEFSSFF